MRPASAQARRQRAADAVTLSLRRYADRGVFRGFRAERGRGGRSEYEFVWLTRRPMRVVFDPARSNLTFPGLFPAVPARSSLERDLKVVVERRADRRLPAHRRLDRRKAQVECSRRAGALTLVLRIRGAQQEYAVRHALNLVNELFLLLQESYPGYLIQHFGASTE